MTDDEAGQLRGRTAVVIGGASGIELTIARRFIDKGAAVLLSGPRQAPRAAVASRAGAVRCDVSDLDDLDRLAAVTREHSGQIDA